MDSYTFALKRKEFTFLRFFSHLFSSVRTIIRFVSKEIDLFRIHPFREDMMCLCCALANMTSILFFRGAGVLFEMKRASAHIG